MYEREDYCKLLPTIKIKRRDSKRLELICKTWRKESSENNCEYEVIIKHTGKEIKIIKLNSFHSECCKYSKYMTTTNNNKDTLNHERMLFLKSLNSTISTTTALCKGYVYSCNDDTTLSTARTTVAISALDADSTSYSNDDNTSPVTQTTLAINALDADSTTTNLHCNNDITSPATQTTLAINALDADSTTTNLHCNNDITFPATQTTVAIVDANT